MHSAALAERGDAKSSEFADRLMAIFEAIALHGPISLNDLSNQTGIPKVSVWRASRSLRENGWVRLRVIDGQLETAPRFDRLLSAAHVPEPEVDELAEISQTCAVYDDLAIAIGIFCGPGVFMEIESTKRGTPIHEPLSLVHDIQASAALQLLPIPEVQRHLEAYARSAVPDERQLIKSGARLRDILSHVAPTQLVWSHDLRQFAAPWVFQTGTVGAIRFFPRRSSGASHISLQNAAAAMQEILSAEESPALGGGRTRQVYAQGAN